MYKPDEIQNIHDGYIYLTNGARVLVTAEIKNQLLIQYDEEFKFFDRMEKELKKLREKRRAAMAETLDTEAYGEYIMTVLETLDKQIEYFTNKTDTIYKNIYALRWRC